MTTKKQYTDFDNLVKTIKNEVRKNRNYKLYYRTLSKSSMRFTVKRYFENITFELFFVRYNKETDSTELCFKFENTEYEIYYVDSRYLVYINNKPMNIDYKNLKIIIDSELQKQKKINQSKVFPDSIIIETLNDNKSDFPIVTNFVCPICHSNKLIIKEENDLRIENYTNYNKQLRDENPDCFPDFCKAAFSGFLYCNDCEEYIAVLGDYSFEEGIINETFEGGDLLHVDEYKIKYMERVNDLINLDYLKYENLKATIRESFPLYYADNESCANKIRVFLDLYLTKLGVSENKLDGKFYPLRERIKDCKSISKHQKEILSVLTKFGNEGSHGGGEITKEDLYNAYKVLEEILYQENNKENIKKLKYKFGKKKRKI